MDNKQCVFLTLLDLSAAFDTIDHGVLLLTLKTRLGIDGVALQWLELYLSQRSQCVLIDGVQSPTQELPYGVPQGSVLGPLLFCAYMTELGDIIRKHNINFHIYADDTQLYVAFNHNDPAMTLQRLESCIGDIRMWMVHHKLKLNDDKSEFIVISSPHNKKEVNSINIKIGDKVLSASCNVRDLGVVIDSVFNMDAHVTSVCKSCYFHLRNIGAIRPYLDSHSASQIIHAFITSRLDYCNSLLFGLSDKSLNRLRKVQNTAVRIVTLCKRNDHITPYLKELHWLPVHLRIDFKILLITYKILNGLAPEYLCTLVKLYAPPRELRSGSQYLLEPILSHSVNYGDRAFSIAAPHLWNNLPLNIRTSETLSVFKTKLKTHLFTKF